MDKKNHQEVPTFNNDDGVLAHNIIKPIQDLLSALDLPEALVHGTVFHIHDLPITKVREGNGVSRWLARHPRLLLGNLVAPQSLLTDATAGKVLQELGREWAEVARLRLLHLTHNGLLSLGQHCKCNETMLQNTPILCGKEAGRPRLR